MQSIDYLLCDILHFSTSGIHSSTKSKISSNSDFFYEKTHSNNIKLNLGTTNTGHPVEFHCKNPFSLPIQQYLKHYYFGQIPRFAHLNDVAENLRRPIYQEYTV